MQEIKITISVDEANLILEALGDQPFKTVYPLISKIQQQAASQLEQNEPEQPTQLETKDG